MKLTVKEILIRARKKIANPANWCQRKYHNGRGAHCAIGAIQTVTKSDDGFFKARNALTAAIEALNYNTGSVVAFNDSSSRIHADVLEVYDLAIKSQPRREK
jgi:hypothetical protein